MLRRPPRTAGAAAAGSRSTCSGASLALALAVAALGGCGSGRVLATSERDVAGQSSASVDPLAGLRAWEMATRSKTDFAHVRGSDVGLGTDPYVIRSLEGAQGPGHAPCFAGILRGRDALVELDGALTEVGRLPSPASPTGLAVAKGGDVFVVGELSTRVARFRTVGGRLQAAGSIDLVDARAMRDVATGPEGLVYVVEEHDGRLITFRPSASDDASPADRVDDPLCNGPLHVARVDRYLLVDCLLDHQLIVRSVDERGFPRRSGEVRIARDGPIWGMDAIAQGGRLLVAVGAVEDHPLDRTQGSFGFIDSFAALYSVAEGTVSKLGEVNTSAFGVVTPKAVLLARPSSSAVELVIAGYGSGELATLDWADPGTPAPPTVHEQSVPPGVAMIERAADGSWLMANPLLDAWVRVTARDVAVVPVEDDLSRVRPLDSKLGEALFFTTLMAPWNRSDGRLSRFACETCHFEGYVDGRTHHTGRGDVHATTKPLFGLFNNRPHFSRALDPDLTTMVNNEFRVAGANSGHDPWFSLSPEAVPWLRYLGVQAETLTPLTLRRSLMSFLMDFAPRPNPVAAGRKSFSDVERAGAEVFRSRCESCHEARLVADEPSTRVPFSRWEDLVMSREGPIVWAHAEYEKTGVEPYVNERGARVVSLRRLYKKHPYFTNGSAKDLRTILDGARFANGRFWHEGAPDTATSLTDQEKSQLAAFLDLL